MLDKFLRWISERGIDSIDEVTSETAEAYRRYLFHARNKSTGKPLSFGYQASCLCTVKRWFAWLVDANWLAIDPTLKLKLPRDGKRLPMGHLTLSQVETVLNQADVTTPLGIRDRAIMETFYSTGIRRLELVNLQLYEINRENRLLTIRQGKGCKDRVVPIGDRALGWIDKWVCDIRPEILQEPTDRLFLTSLGNPFHPVVLSTLVKTYLDSAGIDGRGSCHRFRHTAATLMLENGADLRSLQTMLGHENLNTTQVYTHITIKRLREVHDATHPARPDQLSDKEKGNM